MLPEQPYTVNGGIRMSQEATDVTDKSSSLVLSLFR